MARIMLMKKAATATALALLAAGPVLADVKAGVDAWSAGDYARAVVEWQGPAAAGDPDALFNLAQAYRLGRGVEIDNARARQLYEQAASLGHVKAADNYGLMLFQEGEQERAMPMIRAAADRGDPRAQYVLGLSHFNADYAPRDWVRAYALMTLANGAGLPQARDALAQMDRYVPQAQRAQAQGVAREIEAGAKSQRAAELAAAELGSRPAVVPAVAAAPVPVAAPVAAPVRVPVVTAGGSLRLRPSACPPPPARSPRPLRRLSPPHPGLPPSPPRPLPHPGRAAGASSSVRSGLLAMPTGCGARSAAMPRLSERKRPSCRAARSPA